MHEIKTCDSEDMVSKGYAPTNISGCVIALGKLWGGRCAVDGFSIVQGLVLLPAPNHGRVFKNFLHAYLPD